MASNNLNADLNEAAYAQPQARLRLTRRGRAVFTTLAAVPVVFAAFLFMLNGGVATATMEAGSVSNAATYVTVAGGQSLWQLAEEMAPGEDTREVVAQMMRANTLTTADVHPGQQLTVPTQYR